MGACAVLFEKFDYILTFCTNLLLFYIDIEYVWAVIRQMSYTKILIHSIEYKVSSRKKYFFSGEDGNRTKSFIRI